MGSASSSTSAPVPAPGQVSAHADAVLRRVAITANPFFTALRDGSLGLPAFRRTQEQFSYAVEFFPRPMAALVGRIPDPALRLDVLRNLVEEHGEFNEGRFHKTTFQQFLRSIGGAPEALDRLDLWPCLRAFNSVLTTACVLDELEVGVACMGIIECAFAGCSAVIGAAVVANGWVAVERLVHYKLHAAIDERHAEEFFNVVEGRWADPQRRYFIIQGLELGAYIFDRLYRDLHRAALEA
jgi:pyrroloquinoline-quinone synthase